MAARCAATPHIAKTPHKSLKQHDRPKPHIAAFYPAILRSCCLCSTSALSGIRQRPLSCDRELRCSSHRPRISAGDEQPAGLRHDGRNVAHCWRLSRIGRGALGLHRIGSGAAIRLSDEQRRTGPRQRIDGRHDGRSGRTVAVQRWCHIGEIGAGFGWQRTAAQRRLIATGTGIVGGDPARRAVAVEQLADRRCRISMARRTGGGAGHRCGVPASLAAVLNIRPRR